MSAAVAGVDPHLDMLAVAVVTEAGAEVCGFEVPNSAAGFLRAWEQAQQNGVMLWVVEGSGGYGRAFSRFLTARGAALREAPTRVTAGWRRVEGWAKTDLGDARAVARAGVTAVLPLVARSECSEQLRVLVGHREALVTAQTASLCRIRARLAELDPLLAASLGNLNSLQALNRLSRLQRHSGDYQTTLASLIRSEAQLSRERLREIRRLNTLISGQLPTPGKALVEGIPGIGPIGAAKIIAAVGDIHRFPDHAHFAAYCGAAPLQASSGRLQRHRLNRHGNRQLNRVLDTAIRTQLAHHGPATDYITRRRQEGKTTREAIRALKRHLARRVYNTLTTTTN